jgi:succinyl-CoA synthetase alpha subunit
MSILIDTSTVVLVQGITGKEGAKAAKSMLRYGTKVVAGVTPGKGGTRTEENIPVYNTVREATMAHPEINASLIAVPGKFVGAAAQEAIEAQIPLVNILSERVPLYDIAFIIALGKRAGVRVVGPSSVGIISPGKGKIGSIDSSSGEEKIFTPGNIGVISKSGGMTSEISHVLSKAGFGQSTAMGIGGDILIGFDFLDAALLFEADPDTSAIVLFGEVGGTFEEALATGIMHGKITKPVVALIAGLFAENLPRAVALGHAGAIINGDRGKASTKISILQKAGVYIAETPEDIITILKKIT